jgi:hypothetical protein
MFRQAVELRFCGSTTLKMCTTGIEGLESSGRMIDRGGWAAERGGGHVAGYSPFITTFRPGGGARQAVSMIVGHPRRISPGLTHDHARYPARYPIRVSGVRKPRSTPAVQAL